MIKDFDKKLQKVLKCQKDFGHLVVHIKDKVPHAVYCGRGGSSKLYNPYSHKTGTMAKYVVGSREEAVVAFSDYLKEEIAAGRISPEKDLVPLAGYKLACFCSPLLCHCHVLAAAAAYYKKDLGRG